MIRHRTRFTAACLPALVGCSLLPLFASDPAAVPPATVGRPEGFHPRRTPVVAVVERVRAAVVNIHSERAARAAGSGDLFAFAPSQNRVNGMGTGILIDPRGYIVTNQHVVEDVSSLRVRLHDGSTHTARVVARSPEHDLALLKIDAGRPLPTMPLGTSADLMVGETVIAVGNAYGYEHTVTVGVVSALKRDVVLNKDISYKALIQTDASINPGNSGGPLLNIHGELVGVNVAIRAGAQGIGFAIPVDTVLRVVSDLASIRRCNGTWHGLVCRDVVEPAPGGDLLARRVVVEQIDPAGPAVRAGLQPGDVLLRVGDTNVRTGLDVERALLDRAAGERVPVLVRRKNAEQKLELVLQSLEQAEASASEVVWKKLGLRLTPVSVELVTRVNQQLHGGLAVHDVAGDGPAARAGFQPGDILIGLHQWETLNLDNVVFVLTHPNLTSFYPLRFFIIRAGQVHRGWIQD